MKNTTIKKKNARRTTSLLRDRVTITVNIADIDTVRAFAYTVKAYDTNGATVTRFTLYASVPVTTDVIADYVINNMLYWYWCVTNTLEIARYTATHRHGRIINFEKLCAHSWFFKRCGLRAEYA